MGVARFNYLTRWERKRARPVSAVMFDKVCRGDALVAKGEAS